MSQPDSGPEDDGYIGYMLSDVARLIRTVFDRRVRDIGLTRAPACFVNRQRADIDCRDVEALLG